MLMGRLYVFLGEVSFQVLCPIFKDQSFSIFLLKAFIEHLPCSSHHILSLGNDDNKPIVTLFWATYIAKEKNRCTEESLRKSNMFFSQILDVYFRFSLNFYSVLLSTNKFFFFFSTFSYSIWFQMVTLAPKTI